MTILRPGQIYVLASRVVAFVDPGLVTAIALVESSGNPYAIRYEEKFRYWSDAYKSPQGCSISTEIFLQKCSWGLMQIMGATARSQGFEGWLTELIDPEVNIRWAVKYLEVLASKYPDTHDTIASYNAGSPRLGSDGKYVNQRYVEMVLEQLGRITEHGGIT